MMKSLKIKTWSPSVSWSKKKDIYSMSVYLQMLFFPIHILRLFGRLPWTRTSQGEMRIKWVSLSMLYTICSYAFTLYVLILNTDRTLSYFKMEDSFVGCLVHVIMGLISLFHYYIPLIVWRECPSVAKYFNSWAEFENLVTLNGGEIKLSKNLKWGIRVWTLVVCPCFSITAHFQMKLVKTAVWYHIVLFFIITYSIQLIMIIWVSTCLLICSSAEYLIRRTVDAIAGDGGALEIAKRRQEWMKLSILSRELGNTYCITITLISLVTGITFVSSCFTLLSAFTNPEYAKHYYAIAGFMIPSFGFIVLMTEAAYLVENKLGPDFVCEIVKLDLTHLSTTGHKEVEYLLHATNQYKPIVTTGGYVIVNRGLLVKFLSMTVTYLVVLVQFRVSEPADDFSRTLNNTRHHFFS